MPAETATTDERFARALVFELGAHTRAAARVERLRYGQAFLEERLRVYASVRRPPAKSRASRR